MLTRAVGFVSDGLQLEGELYLPDSPRWLVVLCHGIPGGGPPDPTDPGYAGLARAVAARGHAAMWFNFRGCRTAPGDFSAAGWKQDLRAALDALRGRGELEGLPVTILGSSAGGAAALCVAPERAEVRAVIAFAAPAAFEWEGQDSASVIQRFRNIGIIRDPAFPLDPSGWFGEFDELAAEKRIGEVSPRPVVLIHGDADEIVPYPHAERLFGLAGEPKELIRIPGGRHQLRHDARALDAAFDWLENHLPGMSVSR